MRARGFTLLEVLVAMSIFAIIGLGANQMLQTVIDSHERIRQSSERMIGLMRGVSRVQRDMVQIVPRSVRDEYGEPMAPLMVGTGRYPVEFTRTGWNNPLGRQRSELQRVAYELVDSELRRHFWFVLDRAEDSEPVTQVLLTGVDDFRVNLVNKTGELTDTWPSLDAETPLPRAVEIVIASRGEGEMRRLIPLPAKAELEKERLAEGGGRGDGEDLSVEQVDEGARNE